MNDVNSFILDSIEKHSYIKINDQLYLKQYQCDVLDYYHIPYQKCSSVSEILFLIDEIIDSEDGEDYDALEEVALSLQEFHYYHNTNK